LATFLVLTDFVAAEFGIVLKQYLSHLEQNSSDFVYNAWEARILWMHFVPAGESW
jgi:hypothetical protein